MGTNTNVNAHVNTLATHTRHGEKQKSTRCGDDRGGRSTDNNELAFVSAHDLEGV
jgi:hypothetical protein